MRAILCFKNLEEENADQCSCGEDLRETLTNFHDELVARIKAVCSSEEKEGGEEEKAEEPSKPWTQRIMNIVKMVKAADQEPETAEKEGPRAEGIFFQFLKRGHSIFCILILYMHLSFVLCSIVTLV